MRPAFLVALLTLAVSAIGFKAAINSFNIHLRKKPIYPQPIAGQERLLRAIPTETENWIRLGTDHIESAETETVLGTQNYLTRQYIRKNLPEGERPKAIQLHAAYYTGMIDTVPHVPERCYVGGGLSQVAGAVNVPIRIDPTLLRAAEDPPKELEGKLYTMRLSNRWSTGGGGRRVNMPIGMTPETPLELRVTEYASPGRDGRLFAGYFFIANGGWVSSAEGVRVLAFDLTTDYAYYLKVQVSSGEVSSAQELADLAAGLFGELLGDIMTCVPDWIEVQRGNWPPDNPKRAVASGAGR